MKTQSGMVNENAKLVRCVGSFAAVVNKSNECKFLAISQNAFQSSEVLNIDSVTLACKGGV